MKWKFLSQYTNTIHTDSVNKVSTASGDYLVSFITPPFTTGSYIFMIGLVSLFNGISTFVGYLMPKPFS